MLLALPELAAGEWIPGCVKRPNVFRNVDLILGNDHFSGEFLLVLKPGIWHSQIEITGNFNCRVCPQKDLPMIVHGLQNGRKSNVQHAHILPTERVPKNFHFLPFRIGHNLTGDVHLIGVVENIKAQVVGNVSEIDLLKGGKPELHNVLNLFSSDLNFIIELRQELFS